MKKCLAVLFAIMMLSLVACGKENITVSIKPMDRGIYLMLNPPKPIPDDCLDIDEEEVFYYPPEPDHEPDPADNEYEDVEAKEYAEDDTELENKNEKDAHKQSDLTTKELMQNPEYRKKAYEIAAKRKAENAGKNSELEVHYGPDED